jgi:hypothetical protein
MRAAAITQACIRSRKSGEVVSLKAAENVGAAPA